jgi:hypothetical protein
VKSFRLNCPARLLMVALLMFSWLIATNHCAFGLMNATPKAEAEHSRCCDGKPPSSKDAPTNGLRECCKSIHATTLPVKAEVKVDATKFQLRHFILLQVLAFEALEGALSSFTFDHGPPRAVSFAETVLQRSLFSHAPPFAV